MFRSSFLILILSLSSLYSFSQDAELKRLIALPDDTSKVNKLIAYNKGLLNQDQKAYEKNSDLIITISKRLQYNKGIAVGYSFLGSLNYAKGNNRSAIASYNEALMYTKKDNNNLGVAKCLGSIASAYDGMGKSDSAIVHRMSAITLLEKLKDSPDFSAKEMRALSMQYYNVATGYDNFLEQDDKALSYYYKAEALARKSNDTSMLVSSLQGITQIQKTKGRIKEAFVTAREALQLGKASKNNAILANGYDSYAIVLLANNEVVPAIDAARLAVKYALLAGDITEYVVCSITLSTALNTKGGYKEQISVLQKALKMIAETDNIEFTSDLYEPLAEANYKIGNYQAAYEYLNKKSLFKDSIMKMENNRIVADLEFQYHTAQNEKTITQRNLEVAQKEVQLQKSRQGLLYSFGATLLALLATLLIFLRFKNKRKLHQKQLQSLRQQQEIHLLQALMQGEEKERSRIAKDLHDGVAGMLAAVKMHFNSHTFQHDTIAHSQSYRQGIKLLDEAAHEVRKTSHNLMPEVLLQYGLDEAVNRYCNSINNSNSLKVQYDSWGEFSRYKDSFELSVYRIVQELLNNIIKHSKANEAIVQMSHQNNILSITVEDNGVGFNNGTGNTGGMGLNSLKSRVKAMNGKLEMESAVGSGVSAYLEFETAGLEEQVAMEEA